MSETVNLFESLSEAIVDASSLIYMRESGFFGLLAAELKLWSPEDVIKETGFNDVNVNVLDSLALSPDQQIVHYAVLNKWPVISEDKKVLLAAKGHNLPYYNAIMMLNFLFYQQRINLKQYEVFLIELKSVAWYSQEVLRQAQDNFEAIKKERQQ